jgi:GT2 family glycosyltransferase
LCERGTSTTPISISIVIPAFNSARELEESLPALMAQTAPDHEVFVVDDGSTDGTARVASAHGARLLRHVTNRGPAEARNHGARHARGAVLLFLDADVIAHPDVLSRLGEIFHGEPDVAAVFGSYDAFPRGRGLVSRYRNLLHHFVHQQADREAETFWAGLGAVRRMAFEEVGGFDAARFKQPSIEDIELGYRLRRAGYHIRLDRGLQGTHLKAWTFSSTIRTDIMHRALPWARLILESGSSVRDLNLRVGQRWSAVLLASALVAAAVAPVRSEFWGLALVALVAVTVLNRRFYALLWRQGGLLLVLGSVPLHFLYFFYSGVTFLYAWAEWRVRKAAAALRPRSRA